MTSRVWVITGTSSGLGFALAQHVLAEGDKVVATVRSRAKFPKELEALGAVPIVIDFLASDDAIKRAAEEALHAYGRVDVLVNNAATLFGGIQAVEELSMSSTRDVFQVNLFSILTFTQPFITYFRKRRAGHIMNISTRGGVASIPSMGGYCATKAALNAFTGSLHAELAPYGVRVTALLAGYFPSNIFASAKQPLSRIYTDPGTQGYDGVRHIPERCIARGWDGDIVKYAARIYEIVAGTGIAKEVGVSGTNTSDAWRIVVGMDAGVICTEELEAMLHDIKTQKPLWSSTNVVSAKL